MVIVKHDRRKVYLHIGEGSCVYWRANRKQATEFCLTQARKQARLHGGILEAA